MFYCDLETKASVCFDFSMKTEDLQTDFEKNAPNRKAIYSI